jgi:hypothetical protein
MPVWLFILLLIVVLVAGVVLWRLLPGTLRMIVLVVAVLMILGLSLGFALSVGHHHAHLSVGAGPGPSSSPALTPTTTSAQATSPPATPTTTGSSTGSPAPASPPAANGASSTGGGSFGGAASSTSVSDKECAAATPGPSGLVAVVHFAAGPLLGGGTIPVLIKVCRVAPSSKEAANFLVAFGVAADAQPVSDYAALDFQGGGAYRLFQDNWFMLPDLSVGQAWYLPATLHVPAQPSGSVSLCVWATFGGLGGLPSHDASGNAVMDWQDPQLGPARCKAYA